MELFHTPESLREKEKEDVNFKGVIDDVNNVAIALIDSSGSTGTIFNDGKNKTVFEKFCDVLETLPHDRFRLIFWSSAGHSKGNFRNGVMVYTHVVEKKTLRTVFNIAKTGYGGGTEPNIGFRVIPQEWKKNNPMVYYFTDGDYDRSIKVQLADEIRSLNLRLSIIAVANQVLDLTNLEVVEKSCGGDVFKLVQENRLTKMVKRFESHTLTKDGKVQCVVQIDRIQAPPGYIPYGEKFFSELHVNEFMTFLRHFLNDPAHSDESFQLEVAQKLSITLDYLTKDKPKRVSDEIIRSFSSLFSMDQNAVLFILSDAIQRERDGNAGVLAQYRSELKDLFKQADKLLKQDVIGNVSGGATRFVSIPLNGRVLTGSHRLVDSTVNIDNFTYPRGGFLPHIPVFPLLLADQNGQVRLSLLQEQCTRQWIRAIIGKLYHMNVQSERIIYFVMALNYIVQKSPSISEDVKKGYKNLVRIMLNKKRTNSVDTTEYDRLLAGDAPVPNSGKMNDFFGDMDAVINRFFQKDQKVEPMHVWYALCSEFNVKVAEAQEKHCNNPPKETLLKALTLFEEDRVPDSFTLDYSCIVTLDDVSQVGGFTINPHHGVAGLCSPIFVISDEGKRQMLNNANCVCPVCYQKLDQSSFSAVGPKTSFILHDSYKESEELFKSRSSQPPMQKQNQRGGNGNGNNNNNNNNVVGAIRNANGKTGKLVIMKGTVGSGKTTTSERIREKVVNRGGSCYIEGTDKYSSQGMAFRETFDCIQNSLNEIRNDKNDDIVVIIDTCGEKTSQNDYNVFGMDFSGWKKVEIFPNLNKKNMRGYCCWTLRNVLRRGNIEKGSNFYLTPATAGKQTCIDVHFKKCKALFPRDLKGINLKGSTVDSLNNEADAYEKNNLPVEVPEV